MSQMQEIIGKPISRKEALAIACEILARAERKRIEIAEIEASLKEYNNYVSKTLHSV